MKQLEKKIFINTKMKLITGLRIGDSKENVEIGGVDSPVVRRKDNYQPYIPGSSLKGKIRCLLELVMGGYADNCQNNGSIICDLFGASENTNETKRLKKLIKDATSEDIKTSLRSELKKYEGQQSKILVRDAFLTEQSAEKLRASQYTDLPYTEVKWENIINREKGTAEHPRQIERIPAGAEFDVEFIINIYKEDDETNLYNLFKRGIELLEADYLGGSGTRGYGKVEFIDLNKEEKTRAYYLRDIITEA
jgi:CRISPR-associated protein Csm3